MCLLFWRHLLLGSGQRLQMVLEQCQILPLSPPPPLRLLEHCRKHKYLSGSGEVFALLVSSLLENLLDYRTIIMHDESKENRMSCTVNVLVGARPWHGGRAGSLAAPHPPWSAPSRPHRHEGSWGHFMESVLLSLKMPAPQSLKINVETGMENATWAFTCLSEGHPGPVPQPCVCVVLHCWDYWSWTNLHEKPCTVSRVSGPEILGWEIAAALPFPRLPCLGPQALGLWVALPLPTNPTTYHPCFPEKAECQEACVKASCLFP